MKRQYVVPGITIERYAVTQSVANCFIKISARNDDCVLADPDASDYMKIMAMNGWFLDGFACDISLEESDGNDFICYHTSVQQAFNS